MTIKTLDANSLASLIAASNNICLIDVRGEAEVARGYIKGALNIPLQQLPMRIKELDPKQPTIFYCQIGARSAQAASYAEAYGFADVGNLLGGLTAWSHANFPVEQ